MTLTSHGPKGKFSQWLEARRSRLGECAPFSIVIASPCLVCQPRIAESVTTYLNEFDEQSDGSSWLFVNDDRYEKIRECLLSENALPPHHRNGNEAVTDFLLSCGNVVFESANLESSFVSPENIFHVHLSCSEPEDANPHLWLNAKKIDPETLTLMIASSFIEWTNRDSNWTSAHAE
jgi:hypothetical protein